MSRKGICFALFFVLPAVVLADVPQVISYQGLVTDTETGEPLTGSHIITFKLFTSETGLDEIWMETHLNVPVANGLYNIMLGSVDSFPKDVDFSEQYWLEVIIDGQVLSPRYRLSASPYALNVPDDIVFADIRDSSGETRFTLTNADPGLQIIGEGLASVKFDEESHAVKIGALTEERAGIPFVRGRGTENYIPIWVGPKRIRNSQIYDDGTNVGIGTATPGYKLDIAGICHADTFIGDGSQLTGIETNWDTLKAYWDTTNTLGMLLLNESDSSIWMESSHAVGYFSIALGFGAEAKSQYTTVCGGEFNVASGAWSTVGGGQGNTANHQFATIGGGSGNTADSMYSTIAGGFGNRTHYFGTVGGGCNNKSEGHYSTIAGGNRNTASGQYATISGGGNNKITVFGPYSTIPGGEGNYVSGYNSFVLGRYDTLTADSTILLGLPTIVDGPLTIGEYTLPKEDGDWNQVLVTDAAGNISWKNANEILETSEDCVPWLLESEVIYTANWATENHDQCTTAFYGVAKGHAGNTLTGFRRTHVNLGASSIAGAAGMSFCTISGGYNNTASGDTSTIAGGANNVASGSVSAIAGGSSNKAIGNVSFVGGGFENEARADTSFIGGGKKNIIDANHIFGTIGGGFDNLVSNNFGAICGGDSNAVNRYCFVGGGHQNRAIGSLTGGCAAIAGGDTNIVSGAYGSIIGGHKNLIYSDYSTIGGGDTNLIDNHTDYSFIGGGEENYIRNAKYVTIAGGYSNQVGGYAGFIGGGYENEIYDSTQYNTIGGGYYNTIAETDSCFIGGGANNRIDPASHSSVIGGGGSNYIQTGGLTGYATICGGHIDTIYSEYGAIVGGNHNVIDSRTPNGIIGGGSNNIIGGGPCLGHITIAGGQSNIVTGAFSSIAGGKGNTIYHEYSFIGGGENNTTDSVYTTVCGGFSNEAINTAATVCGGYNNYANAYASVCGGSNNRAEFWYSNVCGGFDNKATHIYSTVCGGYNNQVNGEGSVIPGGRENIVNGGYSLAFGNGVSVDDDHVVAFYNASAPGKLGINNPDPNSALDVNGSVALPIRNTSAVTVDVFDTDYTVIYTGGSSAIINLPNPSGIAGRIYVIKNAAFASVLITIKSPLGGNIDDELGTDGKLLDHWESMTVQSDGTNWYIISKKEP